ncbi:unnamed protein product [Rodentolepis nana]|uniref:Uncharacterized protein n=1 Tax=Rodentolepis nana TaxID=102285 RepID=A0A0R3T3D8_RODNA|nr:unnamed protein product [Rodentolepis nana]
MSLVANSHYTEERRRSVLPTNTPNIHRPNSITLETDDNGLDDSTGSSLLLRASFAANSFRRMSRVFRDEGPAKGFLRVAIGDPNRPKYMQLSLENDELHAEWKRLRSFVQNFHEEYKASKEALMMDPYRRYKRLCAMVKKLVLHLRLSDPTPSSVNNGGAGAARASSLKGQVLQSTVKEREMRQKHCNMCDSYTTEELARETDKLRERNVDLQNRIDLLIDNINELSDSYDKCKRTAPLLRYHHLKNAIKFFLANNSVDN